MPRVSILMTYSKYFQNELLALGLRIICARYARITPPSVLLIYSTYRLIVSADCAPTENRFSIISASIILREFGRSKKEINFAISLNFVSSAYMKTHTDSILS